MNPLSANCTSNFNFELMTASTFDICSGEIKDTYAEPFVCPYRWIDCNRDSDKISLTVS